MELHPILTAQAEPRRLDGADRSTVEVHHGLERVIHVDSPAGSVLDERLRGPAHGGDLADEVAREVDHMRTQVAQGARAGDLAVHSPDLLECRIGDPFLQVATAEVINLP